MAKTNREALLNRPYGPDTAFFIRLWYFGTYRGCRATRRLSVKQIAKVMRRSQESVRRALCGCEAWKDEKKGGRGGCT